MDKKWIKIAELPYGIVIKNLRGLREQYRDEHYFMSNINLEHDGKDERTSKPELKWHGFLYVNEPFVDIIKAEIEKLPADRKAEITFF